MPIIEFLKNRFVQVLLAALIALVLGFTSGYSYKADKVELERLQQFQVIQTKLDKVYNFSQAEATNAKSIDLALGIR